MTGPSIIDKPKAIRLFKGSTQLRDAMDMRQQGMTHFRGNGHTKDPTVAPS